MCAQHERRRSVGHLQVNSAFNFVASVYGAKATKSTMCTSCYSHSLKPRRHKRLLDLYFYFILIKLQFGHFLIKVVMIMMTWMQLKVKLVLMSSNLQINSTSALYGYWQISSDLDLFTNLNFGAIFRQLRWSVLK